MNNSEQCSARNVANTIEKVIETRQKRIDGLYHATQSNFTANVINLPVFDVYSCRQTADAYTSGERAIHKKNHIQTPRSKSDE